MVKQWLEQGRNTRESPVFLVEPADSGHFKLLDNAAQQLTRLHGNSHSSLGPPAGRMEADMEAIASGLLGGQHLGKNDVNLESLERQCRTDLCS